jgi:hypothetical protein
MKALEDIGDDQEPEVETVSSVLDTMVDQTAANDEEEDDDDDGDEQNNDDIGLAARIAKRSINATTNLENDSQQMKRLRAAETLSA